MELMVILPLVIQYGPVAIEMIERLVALLKPLFADGGQPTEEQIRAVFEEVLPRSHERLQSTE